MNRKDLIDAIRTIGAATGRGTTETARAITTVNLALRQLWADMPDALLREEWRIKLEPVIKTSTISVAPTDDRIMTLDVPPVAPTQIPTDGTARGRWIRITRGGVHYLRRIQDVYVQVIIDFPDKLHIVLDRPWDNVTDTGLSYVIYTYMYPYPPDVQRVTAVYYDPTRSPTETMSPELKEGLDEIRWTEGWFQEGKPCRYGRGDFQQIDAPRYTPVASAPDPGTQVNTEKWGFNPVTGIEHTTPLVPYYGTAGTFSYRCCHVWGRRPYDAWSRGDRGAGERGPLLPWYISSPSDPSNHQLTTWGDSRILVTSPDVHHDYHYGPDDTKLHYHRYGWEKWWFRARHLTEDPTTPGNNAVFKNQANDAVYWLWRITEAHITDVYDHGHLDPLDRTFPLKDFGGHQSLQLDRLPTDGDPRLLAMVLRRPPVLQHDHDSPRLPAECYMPLINLACAYLLGRRDGKPDRESAYWGAYQSELNRLRTIYGTPGHDRSIFGDGLSSRGGLIDYPTDITDIT